MCDSGGCGDDCEEVRIWNERVGNERVWERREGGWNVRVGCVTYTIVG